MKGPALRPQPPEHWGWRKQLAHFEGRLSKRISQRTQMAIAAYVSVFTLLCLLMLAGCSDPLYVYSSQEWTRDRIVAIEDAGDLLGYELQPITGKHGAVEIIWWGGGACSSNEDASGCADTEQYGCRRRVYSVESGTILAHEIGHAFRLDHIDERGDLMDPLAGSESFIERDTFDRRVRRFQDCTVTIHE